MKSARSPRSSAQDRSRRRCSGATRSLRLRSHARCRSAAPCTQMYRRALENEPPGAVRATARAHPRRRSRASARPDRDAMGERRALARLVLSSATAPAGADESRAEIAKNFRPVRHHGEAHQPTSPLRRSCASAQRAPGGWLPRQRLRSFNGLGVRRVNASLTRWGCALPPRPSAAESTRVRTFLAIGIVMHRSDKARRRR